MSEEQSATRGDLLSMTAEIAGAHLSNNAVASGDVPALIQAVFDSLTTLANPEHRAPAAPTPAVPIRRSVTDDYIVCLEDGKKLKMLKRHLMTAYGMTPQEYRAKWELPHDYPMVAPSYARTRQELARAIGLGRKPKSAPAAKSRRSPRTKKAA